MAFSSYALALPPMGYLATASLAESPCRGVSRKVTLEQPEIRTRQKDHGWPNRPTIRLRTKVAQVSELAGKGLFTPAHTALVLLIALKHSAGICVAKNPS